MPRELKCETASGGVRGIRRRKGAGFSSEIETFQDFRVGIIYMKVARGLASRLRLKPIREPRSQKSTPGRKGAGFSSEIETKFTRPEAR